jgi:hypothetical protein
MTSRVNPITLLFVLTVMLAGCSGPDKEASGRSAQSSESGSGMVLTVAEALREDREAAQVRGYVLISADGVTRLCTGLAGSYPPQCGGPSITVEGLSADDVPDSESDQGLTWSGETTLRGAVSGGVLVVS